MRDANWRKKYLELRRNFINAMDNSYRQGYEQGAVEAQMQAMQEQMMQQQAMMQQQQAAAQGGEQPQEEDDGQGAPAQEDPNAGQPQGAPMEANQEGAMPVAPQDSELGQYIQQLDDIVNKSEIDVVSLKKSLQNIKNYQTNVQLTKSLKKISPNNLNKPMFPKKLPAKAAHNLGEMGRKTVSMQESIVNNIMKSWESEASTAAAESLRAVSTEPMSKKE